MAFHPVPSTAQVVMQYLCCDQVCQNTYWVKGTGTWDATQLEALAVAFEGWESTTAHGERHTDCALTEVRCTDYNVADSFQFIAATNIVGLQPLPACPNNVTISIKAVTGLSGRAKRGRTYWIGIPTAALNGGGHDQTLTTGYLGAVVSHLTALADGTVVLPNGGELVVAHRRSGSAFFTPAQTFPIITFQAADLFLDSQRRRLPGHNRHRR